MIMIVIILLNTQAKITKKKEKDIHIRDRGDIELFITLIMTLT